MTFLRSSARAIGAVPSSPVSHQQRPGAVPWGRSGYTPFGTKPLDLVAIYRPALLVPLPWVLLLLANHHRVTRTVHLCLKAITLVQLSYHLGGSICVKTYFLTVRSLDDIISVFDA